MAAKMPPAFLSKFTGKESKSEEKGEKKLSPAQYKKGEKVEEAKMKAKKK